MEEPRKDQDELPKDEADRRRDELARRILKTPPQPRDLATGKGPAQPKRVTRPERKKPSRKRKPAK